MSPSRTNDLDLRHFDHHDPAQAQRLHELYREARHRCPVVRSEELGGFWLVTGYQDVRAVLSDPATYSSANGPLVPQAVIAPTPPLDSDPPEQRHYRQFLNPLFSKSHVLTTYQPVFEEVARGLVDEMVEAGRCEVVTDLALPFPAAVLARTLLDVADPELLGRIQRLVAAIAANEGFEPWIEIHGVTSDLLAKRRERGVGDADLIDAVLSGSLDGQELTDEQRIGLVLTTLFGGLDTTVGAISTMIYRMVEDTSLEEQLRDPGRLPAGLEELLRYDAPVTGFGRTVTRDTELGGHQLRAGDVVYVAFASANRDETTFECPDQIRLDRARDPQRPHLAFGFGVHRCIGRHFGRVQLEILFGELLRRVRNIRLEESAHVEWTTGHTPRPKSLPITFERADG
jgi:cytochrome P450